MRSLTEVEIEEISGGVVLQVAGTAAGAVIGTIAGMGRVAAANNPSLTEAGGMIFNAALAGAITGYGLSTGSGLLSAGLGALGYGVSETVSQQAAEAN